MADDSSIFSVATVVLSKVIMLTLIDEVFNSSARHFVQPNVARSKTKTDDVMQRKKKKKKNQKTKKYDVWQFSRVSDQKSTHKKSLQSSTF